MNPTAGKDLTIEGPGSDQSDETVDYDSEMSARYGADDHGMKQHVMAFLRSGPNRDRSERGCCSSTRSYG